MPTINRINALEGFLVSDIDDDASPNYYGFIRSDGAWYIIKETVSPGDTTYRYIKGNEGYKIAWTNRLTSTYYYVDEVL